jgi:protein phosphatase
MKRDFKQLTDPGLVRSVNQDHSYIDPDGRFFIVADGMGGHAGGQEASQIATKEIKNYLEAHWESELESEFVLKEALNKANESILEDQASHPERRDMGTTVVVLMFREKLWCAHIGDSRIYRLREGQLEQITEDHTWVALALKHGELTSEQARVHPWRHVLSQCLGRKDLSRIDIQPVEVKSADRFLLCSDGLTEEVPDEIITKVLDNIPLEEAASKLIEEAKLGGGSDNITVVLVAEN